MQKTAAVVILYNPQSDMIDNILSYYRQVDLVYVLDNSDGNNVLIEKLKSYNLIKIIDNRGNIGMSGALNKAASVAIEDGFQFLLTMDQDTSVPDNYVSELLKELEDDENIGIVSAFIVHSKNPRKPENKITENATTLITSGSIINLRAHQKIGGFLDKFFIDYVDNEYCLRMKSFGFEIKKVKSVSIFHELGDVTEKKFLFKNIFPTNHPPLRWYYRTRNRLYVWKTYKDRFPEYVKFDQRVFIKEIVKIILYEKKKMKKINMIFAGYFDFKRGIFGKFNENQ